MHLLLVLLPLLHIVAELHPVVLFEYAGHRVQLLVAEVDVHKLLQQLLLLLSLLELIRQYLLNLRDED